MQFDTIDQIFYVKNKKLNFNCRRCKTISYNRKLKAFSTRKLKKQQINEHFKIFLKHLIHCDRSQIGFL